MVSTFNFANGEGIPLGFGMALAQNGQALNRFAAMSQAEQDRVLQGVHGISSKEEMRAYVARLADSGPGTVSSH